MWQEVANGIFFCDKMIKRSALQWVTPRQLTSNKVSCTQYVYSMYNIVTGSLAVEVSEPAKIHHREIKPQRICEPVRMSPALPIISLKNSSLHPVLNFQRFSILNFQRFFVSSTCSYLVII